MKRSLATVVLACAAAYSAAAVAGNMSLTVQGITGSVELLSFGFGAKQTGTFGGGGGAGKAEIGQFNFTAVESAASPSMLLNLVQGKHIPTARVGILNPDNGAPQSEWVFTDVLVSSMSIVNGDVDPKGKQPNTFLLPATAFGLSFAKFCYRVFAPNGSVAKEMCWDVVNNSTL
jgi:type VI protein secretion system component Hcp